jgi:mitochondrial protein import protein ZIM17
MSWLQKQVRVFAFPSEPLSLFKRHLIADNIGWFKESTDDGRLRTVEDFVRANGEAVHRGRLNNGDIEILD